MICPLHSIRDTVLAPDQPRTTGLTRPAPDAPKEVAPMKTQIMTRDEQMPFGIAACARQDVLAFDLVGRGRATSWTGVLGGHGVHASAFTQGTGVAVVTDGAAYRTPSTGIPAWRPPSC